jgi:prolyl oligopeptidase
MRLFVFVFMSSFTFAQSPLKYPETKKENVIEAYHGVRVEDPYRWLEDDNSAETKAWVKAQNAVTFEWLGTIPQREAIRDRLSKLWNFERFGMPWERGGRWFFTRNSGLQNQSVLYTSETLDAAPRVLIDPNTLSADGTVSLTVSAVSEDGKRIIYGTSKAGSDWQEYRVRDIESGQDLPDLVEWVKFSGVSWAKDGSGFYYSRYPAPAKGGKLTASNKNHSLYFHKLGTQQAADQLIYARPDRPDWGVHGFVTDDGEYLGINLTQGTDPRNRFYYKSLQDPDANVVELLPDFDADYSFIDNVGSIFYFQTNLDAPLYRVIAIDLTQPERQHWREVIPQGPFKLESTSLVGEQLICEYLKNASSAVRCYDLEGKFIRGVELPGIGSVGGFGGRRTDQHTFYSFSSFTQPGSIYRYDITSGESALWKRPQVGFASEQFETKQIFVVSKDGTKVPVFIVGKKGFDQSGPHPCLLYGYGGFDISLTPSFSVARAVWMEMGGVFALANLRGGGEYGQQWHEAGTKLRKQNVFDDFFAAAEGLIERRITTSPQLAIQGGSNGGLLVGACMVQRPELFGAAIPSVGVMDMLRFHKFTIGWAWKSDYGSSESAEEFRALHAYSPLHNLKPGTRYPATLVTTADHDDRVVPAHSFKFAARLQECQAPDGPPVLIRIETSAGHGAGTALSKVIEETADEWAFLVKVLGMDPSL